MEATKNLKAVHMPAEVRLKISEICSLLDVDGIRGDIVTNRAAKALVAFEGREEVSMADVEKVIGLCLNHRYALPQAYPVSGSSESHEGRLLHMSSRRYEGGALSLRPALVLLRSAVVH